MGMTEHPITPPSELVQQWMSEFYGSPATPGELALLIAARSAQWGADQELEACCKLLELSFEWDGSACEDLRAERRPPASLKQQALQELDKVDMLWATEEFGKDTLNSLDTIRRALEALPND